MEEDRKARARDRATTVGAIIFDIIAVIAIIGIIIAVTGLLSKIGLFSNDESEQTGIVSNSEIADISVDGVDYTPAEIVFNGKTYRLVE